jgi:hypothetical protein
MYIDYKKKKKLIIKCNKIKYETKELPVLFYIKFIHLVNYILLVDK